MARCGRGDGPGEFRGITRIGWLRDSRTIWATDGRANRLSMFPKDPAARPESTRYPPRVDAQATAEGSMPAFPFVHIMGLASRDTLVAKLTLGSRADAPGFSGFHTVATIDTEGDIGEVLARVPIDEVHADLPGGGVAVLPFPKRTDVQYASGRRSITSASVEALREDSAMVRIATVDLRGHTTLSRLAPVPTFSIPPAIRDEARLSFASRTGVEPEIPEVYPPLTGLLLGPDGDIWLELANPGEGQRIYSVHRADGSLSGRIAVPDSIRVAAVDGSIVWALEKDDVDVEHLVQYRLTWEATPGG